MILQNGLFDPENALGPGRSIFRKRPTSAKEQREADAQRARPKSAGKITSLLYEHQSHSIQVILSELGKRCIRK